MSTALQTLAAYMQAPPHCVVIKNESRSSIETIADQLALNDEEQSQHQRAADLEEAEWIVAVIQAAGFKLVPVTS